MPEEDLYVLVTWPESQKWMDTPGVLAVEYTEDAGPSAYMVPITSYRAANTADSGGGEVLPEEVE